MRQFDIAIVGGGMVGSASALALARAGFSVALIDAGSMSSQMPNEAGLRVSALTLKTQIFLQNLGVWQAITQHDVCAYQNMRVWEGAGHVHFSAREYGLPALGYIVDNAVTNAALLHACGFQQNVTLVANASLQSLSFVDGAKLAQLELSNGENISTHLVVAADGANSAVRRLMDVSTDESPYEQSGLVAIVGTEKPHNDTAWQHFLPGGPLAFLPLQNGYCSIVWSLPQAIVESRLSMSTEAFEVALTEAFEARLGGVQLKSARAAFPLVRRHAQRYCHDRVVLVGDAAHTIHPLAGQGANLGFMDVAALVDVLVEARTRQRDIGHVRILRRYERWRRGDNALMMRGMDGFHALFGSESSVVQSVRRAGLSAFNFAGPVKARVAAMAAGQRGELPTLMRSSNF